MLIWMCNLITGDRMEFQIIPYSKPSEDLPDWENTVVSFNL